MILPRQPKPGTRQSKVKGRTETETEQMYDRLKSGHVEDGDGGVCDGDGGAWAGTISDGGRHRG